ncbi:Hypothetical protein FKW44_023036, partial [Caligus rogercresseyi]
MWKHLLYFSTENINSLVQLSTVPSLSPCALKINSLCRGPGQQDEEPLHLLHVCPKPERTQLLVNQQLFHDHSISSLFGFLTRTD